jgi:pyridoxine 4-dehydrogenase
MTDGVPGGSLKLADDLVISRIGFGAMQLAGPGVFGPPRDRDQALTVLREAVNLGITHIDTSDFYGPFVVNELIREALHPYPADLRIVTKVGARRGQNGSWQPSLDPADLRAQVRENLEHLGVDVLEAVNLRVSAEGTGEDSIAEQFDTLAGLQKEGLIRHLGISAASDASSPRRRPSRPSSLCRTSTTSPAGPMTLSSTGARPRTSRTRRSSRSAVSPRSSPPR